MFKALNIAFLLACFTFTLNSQTFLIPNTGLRYQTIDYKGWSRERYSQYPLINIFTGLEVSQSITNNFSLSIEADYNLIKYILDFPFTIPYIENQKSHFYQLGISAKYFIANNWQVEVSLMRSFEILDLYHIDGYRISRHFDRLQFSFSGIGITYWTKSFNFSLESYFWISKSKESNMRPGTEPFIANFTIGYPIKITGWKPFKSSKKVRCPKF